MNRRKVIVSCFLIAVAVCVAFALWTRSPKGRVLSDPRFFVTHDVAGGRMGFYAPGDAGIVVREFASAWNSIWKRPDEVISRSFPPREEQACSIQGMLQQATTLTGVRYGIARPLVEGVGAVEFGHANALDPEEWVAALKGALESGTSEWINDINSRFDRLNPRRESLVLITNSPGLILVVPHEWAVKFQQSE